MNAQKIKAEISEKHELFIAFITGLTDEAFLSVKNNKWSAGQQLEHIYLSVKPLRQALSLPRFVLKIAWGKANRNSRTYPGLVEKYLQKLEAGGSATARFIPKPVNIDKRSVLITKLLAEINHLGSKIDRFSEQELDQYILPHPLLGKLTLREMLFFTIYHVEHHQNSILQNLK